jgi:hypothetical protein
MTKVGNQRDRKNPQGKRPLRKRWVAFIFLLSLFLYLESYCVLARSGILIPGHTTYPQGARKRFVLMQQKPITLHNLLNRDQITLSLHPGNPMLESDFEPLYLCLGNRSWLTRAYLPAGYLHQWLDSKGWWPKALKGDVEAIFPDGEVYPVDLSTFRLSERVQELFQRNLASANHESVQKSTVMNESDS